MASVVPKKRRAMDAEIRTWPGSFREAVVPHTMVGWNTSK